MLPALSWVRWEHAVQCFDLQVLSLRAPGPAMSHCCWATWTLLHCTHRWTGACGKLQAMAGRGCIHFPGVAFSLFPTCSPAISEC